jgi:hypothetical protein
MPTELEQRLRRDLRARQAEVPAPPADLADLVRFRHRRQRRAQVLAAVAALAVGTLLAGAAGLLPGTTLGRSSDTAVSPPPGVAPGILDWPTRGSLAGDADWLAEVRSLDWKAPPDLAGEVPDPVVEDRRVAFAGDVPGGRVALVVGEDDGQVGAAWFTGPAEADPAEMELAATPLSVNRTSSQAFVRSASPTAATAVLVAVGPPGSSMDLTAPPAVDAGGHELHQRVELPTEDGVAVSTVQGSWSMTREVRSRVDDRLPFRIMPTVAVTDDPGRADVVIDENQIVDQAAAGILAAYGLSEEQGSPVVLAEGTTDGGKGVVLLGLTFPSEATGVWLLTYEEQEQGWVSSVSRLPHAPAGTPVEQRLTAVAVDGTHLAVHAPAAAVRVEVLTTQGAEIGSVDVRDGAYVGEVPGGSFAQGADGAAKVRALDASGAVLAEASIDRAVGGR